MAPDPPSEKRHLRRTARSWLAQVTPERARIAGEQIAAHLRGDAVWRSAARIALFAPRADEVDTAALWAIARRDGKPVLLPRTTEQGSLEFAEVAGPEGLLPGRFGILEPPRALPAARLGADDLVLLPGLAFDRWGGRLGRGGGYYDRAFAGAPHDAGRPVLVGVGFSFQLVDRVPMTALDVRLDGVVSELGWIWVTTDGAAPRR